MLLGVNAEEQVATTARLHHFVETGLINWQLIAVPSLDAFLVAASNSTEV